MGLHRKTLPCGQYSRRKCSWLTDMLPKLKYEHVYLDSFAKMRVDLAAQVHNNSEHACVYIQIHVIKCQ